MEAEIKKPTDTAVIAAEDELVRELGVRERYYQRWVTEGKLTRTEASTRLHGLRMALGIVRLFVLEGAASEGPAASESANQEPF